MACPIWRLTRGLQRLITSWQQKRWNGRIRERWTWHHPWWKHMSCMSYCQSCLYLKYTPVNYNIACWKMDRLKMIFPIENRDIPPIYVSLPEGRDGWWSLPIPLCKSLMSRLGFHGFHGIWSNYSDLTRPHPKWWFRKGSPLISGKSRLVKYNNLARWYGFWRIFSNPAAVGMKICTIMYLYCLPSTGPAGFQTTILANLGIVSVQFSVKGLEARFRKILWFNSPHPGDTAINKIITNYLKLRT